MRILVTGATGFVGTSLLKGLIPGHHELYGLARSASIEPSHPSVILLQGDVTNPDSLQIIPDGLDIVVHCAGLLGAWGRTWHDYSSVNVVGTKNIADVCRQKGIRNLVHVSSGGAHSRATQYEESKYLSETVLLPFVDTLRVITVRPEFLYGPGDTHVRRLFRAIESKRFVIIGDGNSSVHPTFIGDFVSHMMRLIHSIDQIPSGTTYTVAGPHLTWNAFVRTVCDHYRLHIRFPRIPTPIMRCFAVLNEAVSHRFAFPMILNRDQVYFFSADHTIDTANTILLACPTMLHEGLRYL